jgi:hypothetical protein
MRMGGSAARKAFVDRALSPPVEATLLLRPNFAHVLEVRGFLGHVTLSRNQMREMAAVLAEAETEMEIDDARSERTHVLERRLGASTSRGKN